MKRLSILLFSLLPYAAQTLSAQVEIGKTYRIVPVSRPQSSLFVKDAQPGANVAVVLWTETHVPAQQWTIGRGGTNGFTLCNAYTGLYLGLKANTRGGTLLTVASASSGRWRLEAVDEAQCIYHLRPMSGSNYLGVADTADGSLPALSTPTEDSDQEWQFVEVESPVWEFNATVRSEMADRYIACFAQQKGDAFRTFNNGGWGESEQLEVILDAYETTGNKDYLELATMMYDWFYDRVGSNWTGGSNGNYDWFGYDFNDDVMWQIIAVARLGWLTGDTKYRKMAKYNFDLIYKRALMPEFGMMRWAEQSGDRYSTNSCIMGPTEVAACYLAMTGAGEEYFEKARDLYEKQRQYLADMRTGQVYDSFVWDPATGGVALNEKGEERFNRWASTYNQGTMLGAAVLLYDHYGTPQYAADADKIMEYTVGRMCTADGIISVCQVNDGDLCGFKGILMRYARRYVLDLNRPQYQAWLSKNAFRAYNNRDERGVTTSAWLAKSRSEETTSAFSCSCAASAAVNTVLGQVEKDALTPLPATAFDYQSGIYVLSADDATPAISLKDNTWVAYDNMRFGNTPARSIAIGVGQYPYTGTATVSVYLDKMAGEPIATIPLSQGNADNYVFADIQPTVGIHHVFLRFAYSTRSRTNAFQLTSLQFSTQSAQELSDGINGIRTGKQEDGNGDCESHSPSGKEAVGKYFDLQGRRQSRAPQHGLYISEHRKKVYYHP